MPERDRPFRGHIHVASDFEIQARPSLLLAR